MRGWGEKISNPLFFLAIAAWQRHQFQSSSRVESFPQMKSQVEPQCIKLIL